MDAATAYYRARGWDVKRVSDTKKALDLRIVHRVSGEERRVEVKGSSQDASHVEVTRAEVAISREEACELFVLDKILYQDTGEGADDYTLEGGAAARTSGARMTKTSSRRLTTITWALTSARLTPS
jgi:hypothetical protein